jgi:hypothetical protein
MNRRQLLASLAGLIAALPFVGKAQAEPDDDMIGLVYPGPGEWTETPRFDAAMPSFDRVPLYLAHKHGLDLPHDGGPGAFVFMDEATAAVWDELIALHR